MEDRTTQSHAEGLCSYFCGVSNNINKDDRVSVCSELSRMSPPQERSGNSCEEPMSKCLQAKKDLEIAIAGVAKAEQQVKDNWREVGEGLLT